MSISSKRRADALDDGARVVAEVAAGAAVEHEAGRHASRQRALAGGVGVEREVVGKRLRRGEARGRRDHRRVVGAQLARRDRRASRRAPTGARAAGRWRRRRRRSPGASRRVAPARARSARRAPRRSRAGSSRRGRRRARARRSSPRSRTRYSSAVLTPAKEKSRPSRPRATGNANACGSPSRASRSSAGPPGNGSPSSRAPLSKASPAASSSVRPSTSKRAWSLDARRAACGRRWRSGRRTAAR